MEVRHGFGVASVRDQRQRKVGLKGLLGEGSMLVRPSRAPTLPAQARKTKQGCKRMLLDT